LEIQSLGRYQIRGRLGRGSMGVVYRGFDPVLAREIALKIVDLSPALAVSDREAFLVRFFREARIAAKLLHPGIVVIHDAAIDETTGVPFIAMELVSGGSLADRMELEGRLPWRDASSLVVLMARALDYAHREGVVHRDVKPANVLLSPEGAPKIADFGIAKLLDSHLTKTGPVIGTPYYMSPEQIEAGPIDGRSDLFSLGSLFYALLVGRPPFTGSDLAAISRQILFKNPEPPSEGIAPIPRALDSVLARSLAKNPADRYASGAEMADDLERVLAGEAPQRPLSLGERTIESVKPKLRSAGRPWLGFSMLLILAGLGAYGAYAYWDEAEARFRESRGEAMRREGLRSEAAARLREGKEAFLEGRFQDAGLHIHESLALSREGGNGSGEAEALLLRGLLAAEAGEWPTAFADLEAAASIFEIYEDAEGRERALLEQANLDRDRGDFEKADYTYRKLQSAASLVEGALLSCMRGDCPRAMEVLRAAHQTGAEGARGKAALYLGILASREGRREEAERFWREARQTLGSREVDLYLGAPRTERNAERSRRIGELSLDQKSKR
jgi:tetratricopeptide (TPR) repeat protein